MIGTYVLSAGYYDAYYLKAQQIRRLIRDDFRQAFTEVDLIHAAKRAAHHRFRQLKLYFMVGLPGETEADVA